MPPTALSRALPSRHRIRPLFSPSVLSQPRVRGRAGAFSHLSLAPTTTAAAAVAAVTAARPAVRDSCSSCRRGNERPTASFAGTNQRTDGQTDGCTDGRTDERGSQSKRRRTKETNSTRLDTGLSRGRVAVVPSRFLPRTSSYAPSLSPSPSRAHIQHSRASLSLFLSLSLPSSRAREST